MANVLLCTSDFIRSNSNISDNTNSKVLETAIREVQDDQLQEILGTLLLDKLCNLVVNNEINDPENATYKNVLVKARWFILYKVIGEILVTLNFKIDNAGVLQTTDEQITAVDLDDTLTLKGHYDAKANHYIYLLQNFLLEHRSELPELTQSQAYKIRATLYSAANTGIFLGGARGKGFFRQWPYRCQPGMNLP